MKNKPKNTPKSLKNTAKIDEKTGKKDDLMDVDFPYEDLKSTLLLLLGDLYTLYYKAHSAHWNIVGADFALFHELFGEIYSDIYGSIDPIAEILRKMGIKAPANFNELLSNRTLTDDNVAPNSLALVSDLLKANDYVLDELSDAFESASYNNQQGVANFIAERIDKHQFWKWQLSATLGQDITEPNPDIDEEMEPYEEPENGELVETKSAESQEHKTKSFSASVIKMKAATDAAPFGEVVALVSVFNNIDLVGDRVMPGAFKNCLEEIKTSGKSIPFVWSHQWNNPEAYIGKITNAVETAKGLEVTAQFYNTPTAQHVRQLLTDGVVTQFSFAYDVIDESKATDGANELNELYILEAGPTLKGANPETELVEAKSDAIEKKENTINNVKNDSEAKDEELKVKSEEQVDYDALTALALVEAEIAEL